MRETNSMVRYMFLLSGLAIAGCGGDGDSSSDAGVPVSFQQRCTELVGKSLDAGKITATEILQATDKQPETCKAMGQIETSAKSTIMFRMDLPKDDSWNSKLMQVGGGGYNGVVNNPELPHFAGSGNVRQRGYAFITGDSGHQDPKGGFDFALNNESALDNFMFNSHPQMLKVGVAATQAFYGKAPSRKYFLGNSTGGREALLQAQRYPNSYDGIISGMPVVDYSVVNQKGIAIAQAAFANGGAGWLSQAKVKLFETAQLNACDALDGLKDGIIANTNACQFAAATLRCQGGLDTGDACLSDAQLATVAEMRTRTKLPVAVANAITTAAPLGMGDEASGAGWTTMQLGASATQPASVEFNFASGYLKYGIASSASADVLTYTPGSYAARWLELSQKGNATNPDLSVFANKGAKLLLFHGLTDHLVPPGYSSDYYASVVSKMGLAKTNEFMRFYAVPGVGHSASGYRLNLLEALEDWVENGKAPETLTHTQLNTDQTSIKRTLPMCRYPAWPQYKGTGDVHQASSFRCVNS